MTGDVTRSDEVNAAVAPSRASSAGSTCSSAPRASPGASLRTTTSTTTSGRASWRSTPTASSCEPRGAARDDRARLRAHRQPLLDRGQGGQPHGRRVLASKAAVIAATKAIGKDLATTGVLVNCVTPAPVETPMLGGSARSTSTTCSRGSRWAVSRRPTRRRADRLPREREHVVLHRRGIRPLRRKADVLMGTFTPRGWRLVRLGGGSEPRLGAIDRAAPQVVRDLGERDPIAALRRGLAAGAAEAVGEHVADAPQRSRACRCWLRSSRTRSGRPA